LGEPLYGDGDADSEFFDTSREDFSAVDPDDTVPGEGEECLY
jgi:hypothetical protein